MNFRSRGYLEQLEQVCSKIEFKNLGKPDWEQKVNVLQPRSEFDKKFQI